MTDPKKTGPARKGSLYWTKSGWRARLRVDIDGATVQKSFDLETRDKQAARVKLRRLIRDNPAVEELKEEAARPETFKEAAKRVVDESGIRTTKARLDRLKLHAYPALGSKFVTEITAGDVRDVLQELANGGASRQQCLHVRNDVSAVLGELWRTEVLPENVCRKVRIPKNAKVDKRERAVLREDELVAYLGWQHPEAKKDKAVLERQTMACVSWFFGGLRWGDIRAIRWEAFDTKDGAFTHGLAPRKKTARSQKLEVPEVLRPILRDYWERTGRPATGLVFPVRTGERAGAERKAGSVAKALRRDLRRVFGIDKPRVAPIVRKFPNGEERTDTRITWDPDARQMNDRERELFEETELTRPVDFHSFRRAFKQGLAEAEIDVQRSMKLSGSSDMAAHARYLANTGRPAQIPAEALPQLCISDAQLVDPENANPLDLQCRRADLNRRQRAYEARALTN
jgi:integrase